MKRTTWKTILKTLLLVSIIASICVIVYFILKAFGLNDLETLRKIVNQGIWGVLIYILLQVIQVIFIPLNTSIFTVPAIVLFGPSKAFIISWIGVTLGSIIMFFVGRTGGGKLLNWLVGKEKADKYVKVLGKGKLILPILLLVPVFPDDIMCVSAGIAKINILYFIIVIIITRCIDTFCTCFIAGSMVQSPIGIALLVVFAIGAVIASIFLTKNQEKIENWFIKVFSKKNKKD